MISIDRFKDKLNELGDPAPINRFQVMIFKGQGVTVSTEVTPDLTVLCEQAELPGKSILTVEDKLYGPVRKVAYGQMFIDTTMNFICTGNGWQEKRFFNEWQNSIVDPTLHDASYYEQYTGTILLFTYKNNHNKNYGIRFKEVYPLNVGAVNLSMSQNNDYARLSVTFAYRQWEELEKDRFIASFPPGGPSGTSGIS